MPLRVLPTDNTLQPDEAEIARDWRKWANNIGYIQKKTIPVKQGRMTIVLEMWVHPEMSEHAYLMYHPEIPTTKDTEALYILESQEQLEGLVEISVQMALNVMHMVQIRNNIRNAGLQ
jgi:hypothetical protein